MSLFDLSLLSLSLSAEPKKKRVLPSVSPATGNQARGEGDIVKEALQVLANQTRGLDNTTKDTPSKTSKIQLKIFFIQHNFLADTKIFLLEHIIFLALSNFVVMFEILNE